MLNSMGPRVVSVTLDTNILPPNDLIAAVSPHGFEFAVVSVTDREVSGSAALHAPLSVSREPETLVWGETPWRDGLWSGSAEADCFDRVLHVIAGGSFPHRRNLLTNGERRQLRDAMIFCAHVRAGRDIFVTDDAKGFIRGGRRQQLEQSFGTRIMTRESSRPSSRQNDTQSQDLADALQSSDSQSCFKAL
jgi:hypothetical protein